MIPAYSKKIDLPQKVDTSNASLEEQVSHLSEQVRILRDTVEYMNREKSRLKSEVESLRSYISKR